RDDRTLHRIVARVGERAVAGEEDRHLLAGNHDGGRGPIGEVHLQMTDREAEARDRAARTRLRMLVALDERGEARGGEERGGKADGRGEEKDAFHESYATRPITRSFP